MKRLIVISAAVIFAVILVFGIIAQGPPPQGPPGGGGPGGAGGGGAMMMANMQSALTLNTERSLAYLLLEMNIPDDQLVKVRATYLKSWKAYKELGTKLETVGTDRDAMMAIRADADNINKKRIDALKEIITKADDMKKLNDYETKLNVRPQRQRQGAGGGGPQGGGQPPGGNMQAPPQGQ
ncbi:MAG: hypothetical protein AAB116_20155 [Candidatus Poribacteria bacterium]